MKEINDNVLVKKGEYWSDKGTTDPDVILNDDVQAIIIDYRLLNSFENRFIYTVKLMDGTVLIDVEENELVKAKKIEYGYDRHDRSWCIIVFDNNDNEIDNSYVGDMVSGEFEINRFKEKYHIADVIKIKAY